MVFGFPFRISFCGLTMSSLRIAFLTDYLSTLAGTESSIVTTCELLRQAGDEIIVFHYCREGPTHPYWKMILRDAGVYLVEQPADNFPNGVSAYSFCSTIAEHLRSWEPHLIHAIPLGTLGLIWTMTDLLSEIPIVGTETSEASPRCFWYDPKTFKSFARYRAIIAPCEKVRDGIRSFFDYQGKVVVPPHLVPVPEEEMKPLTPIELENMHRLGSISRLRVEKGPEFMVATLAMLAQINQKITLTIYGETPEIERTRQIAHAFGVEERLYLPGPFNGRSEIDRVVSHHCIFLLSSLFESLPIALLEVIARGRIVVASNVGGIPELFDSLSAGIVVPSGNPQSMAEAVSELIKEPLGLIERGKSGIQRFRERYHVNIVFPRLRQFYMEIARSNNNWSE